MAVRNFPKDVLSFSSYWIYKQCPRKYWFKKFGDPDQYLDEETLPQKYGTVAHNTLARILQENTRSTISIRPILEEEWENQGVQTGKEKLLKALESGIEWVQEKLGNEEERLQPCYIEEIFTCNEKRLGGIVDAAFHAQGCDDAIILIDWKWGKGSKMFSQQYRAQLLFYSYLIEKRRAPVSAIEIWWLERKVREKIEFNIDERNKLIEHMKESADTIFSYKSKPVKEEFPARPSSRCWNCPAGLSCADNKYKSSFVELNSVKTPDEDIPLSASEVITAGECGTSYEPCSLSLEGRVFDRMNGTRFILETAFRDRYLCEFDEANVGDVCFGDWIQCEVRINNHIANIVKMKVLRAQESGKGAL